MYYFLLYRHGLYKTHLLNGSANPFADTKFFKCLQIKKIIIRVQRYKIFLYICTNYENMCILFCECQY